jgi:hypothetical protein
MFPTLGPALFHRLGEQGFQCRNNRSFLKKTKNMGMGPQPHRNSNQHFILWQRSNFFGALQGNNEITELNNEISIHIWYMKKNAKKNQKIFTVRCQRHKHKKEMGYVFLCPEIAPSEKNENIQQVNGFQAIKIATIVASNILCARQFQTMGIHGLILYVGVLTS